MKPTAPESCVGATTAVPAGLGGHGLGSPLPSKAASTPPGPATAHLSSALPVVMGEGVQALSMLCEPALTARLLGDRLQLLLDKCGARPTVEHLSRDYGELLATRACLETYAASGATDVSSAEQWIKSQPGDVTAALNRPLHPGELAEQQDLWSAFTRALLRLLAGGSVGATATAGSYHAAGLQPLLVADVVASGPLRSGANSGVAAAGSDVGALGLQLSNGGAATATAIAALPVHQLAPGLQALLLPAIGGLAPIPLTAGSSGPPGAASIAIGVPPEQQINLDDSVQRLAAAFARALDFTNLTGFNAAVAAAGGAPAVNGATCVAAMPVTAPLQQQQQGQWLLQHAQQLLQQQSADAAVAAAHRHLAIAANAFAAQQQQQALAQQQPQDQVQQQQQQARPLSPSQQQQGFLHPPQQHHQPGADDVLQCLEAASAAAARGASGGQASAHAAPMPMPMPGAPNLPAAELAPLVMTQHLSAEWARERAAMTKELEELRHHKSWADDRIKQLISRMTESERPARGEALRLRDEVSLLRGEKETMEARLRDFEASLARLKDGMYSEASQRREVETRAAAAEAELRGAALREQELAASLREAQAAVKQEKKRREAAERQAKKAADARAEAAAAADASKAAADAACERVARLQKLADERAVALEEQAAVAARSLREAAQRADAAEAARAAAAAVAERAQQQAAAAVECSFAEQRQLAERVALLPSMEAELGRLRAALAAAEQQQAALTALVNRLQQQQQQQAAPAIPSGAGVTSNAPLYSHWGGSSLFASGGPAPRSSGGAF